MENLTCFQAYDIRGIVPDELDASLAEKIGMAFVDVLETVQVVVGKDARLESDGLVEALISGLLKRGAKVIDIGLCGTEEVYFYTTYTKSCGGIMVTASHNPKGYNGMKMVGLGSIPISYGNGLEQIKKRVCELDTLVSTKMSGERIEYKDKSAYISYILDYSGVRSSALKILANAGNGSAGPVIKLLGEVTGMNIKHINSEPDGNFPGGVPNPMLKEQQVVTSNAVIETEADIGIAWDGDFDRCFFFDEGGRFIDGYYIVGLLAQYMLQRYNGGKIVYDTRLVWNTEEVIASSGGVGLKSRSGHAFIKELMRKENALYGGESSGHYYFRDFMYCDSGMIPWLLVLRIMSESGKTLGQLVDSMMQRYPCSGEINYKVKDFDAAIHAIKERFKDRATREERIDGLSIDCSGFRFNIRKSNTEPLIRLNIEAKDNPGIVLACAQEIESVIYSI